MYSLVVSPWDGNISSLEQLCKDCNIYYKIEGAYDEMFHMELYVFYFDNEEDCALVTNYWDNLS
jgi:hypothetical protein